MAPNMKEAIRGEETRMTKFIGGSAIFDSLSHLIAIILALGLELTG